jgi:hypothetical protein
LLLVLVCSILTPRFVLSQRAEPYTTAAMASRLVLVLGDLFIPDRAAVGVHILTYINARPHKLTGYLGYPDEGTRPPQGYN